MALTFTRVPDGFDVWGRTQIIYRDITFDNSYPLTNGYTIRASDVGLKSLFGAQMVGGNKASGGLKFNFDTSATAGNLGTSVVCRVYYPTGGGGTSPTTLAAPKVSTGASTASAVDATSPTITPGLAKEVGDTADLSTIIIRVRFEGR